jgi:hypothetical protein
MAFWIIDLCFERYIKNIYLINILYDTASVPSRTHCKHRDCAHVSAHTKQSLIRQLEYIAAYIHKRYLFENHSSNQQSGSH